MKCFKHKAVTLIELLIVIAIVGILSAVSISSVQSARTSSRLKAAQREVAAAIKLAQSYASQGKAVDTTGMGNWVTPCGYGFRFIDDASYEFFYNLAGTGTCAGTGGKNNIATFLHYVTGEADSSDNSQSLESQSLQNGVKLTDPDPASSPNNNTEIYFTVPHGWIFNGNGEWYSSSQDFTFSLGGSTKTIRFNNGTVVENN